MSKIQEKSLAISSYIQSAKEFASDFHEKNQENILYEVEYQGVEGFGHDQITFVAYDRDGDGLSDASRRVAHSDEKGGMTTETVFEKKADGILDKTHYVDRTETNVGDIFVQRSVNLETKEIERSYAKQGKEKLYTGQESYTHGWEADAAHRGLDHGLLKRNQQTVRDLMARNMLDMNYVELGVSPENTIKQSTVQVEEQSYQLFDMDGDNHADVVIKKSDVKLHAGVPRSRSETYLDTSGNQDIDKVVIKDTKK